MICNCNQFNVFFSIFLRCALVLFHTSVEQERETCSTRTCARYDELRVQRVTVILLLLSFVVIVSVSSISAAQHNFEQATRRHGRLKLHWRCTLTTDNCTILLHLHSFFINFFHTVISFFCTNCKLKLKWVPYEWLTDCPRETESINFAFSSRVNTD